VGSSTAVFPILPATIGTINADGTFNLTSANWSLIARSGLPQPQFILNPIGSINDYGFSGFGLNSAQFNDSNKFAIVTTFQYGVTASVLTVESISVVPGDLPCRPAVKSFDEVVRQCQYYYETNYNLGITPGTATTTGALTFEQPFTSIQTSLSPIVANESFGAGNIQVQYKTIKRATLIPPVPTFYAPDGSIGNLLFSSYPGTGGPNSQDVNIFSRWTLINQNNFSFTLLPNSRTPIYTQSAGNPSQILEATATFFYVADARLGVVI
jgi:hypothetical protein